MTTKIEVVTDYLESNFRDSEIPFDYDNHEEWAESLLCDSNFTVYNQRELKTFCNAWFHQNLCTLPYNFFLHSDSQFLYSVSRTQWECLQRVLPNEVMNQMVRECLKIKDNDYSSHIKRYVRDYGYSDILGGYSGENSILLSDDICSKNYSETYVIVQNIRF